MKIKSLSLNGQPTQLKAYMDSVCLVINNEELRLLEYDGVKGLVLASTVFQKHNPFKTYTFFKAFRSPDKYMLITGDSLNKIFLYSTTLTNYEHLNLGCRYFTIFNIVHLIKT